MANEQQLPMKFRVLSPAFFAAIGAAPAFLSSSSNVVTRAFAPILPTARSFARRPSNLRVLATDVDDASVVADDDGPNDPLGLTPELRRLTDAFASIPDEKMRHKQLLYMANQLPPIDPSVATPENKVPGCLSTVYVDCTAETDEDRGGARVLKYVGDSDGLLTKGLVALLVRGLSGYTAEEISAINPEFINEAKISQSLTPGRNNGFLNMLAVMKRKASEATAEESREGLSSDEQSAETGGEGPLHGAIVGTLAGVLKPTQIELVDLSGGKESKFELRVVADAFEGLAAEKREALVAMLLGDALEQVEELSATLLAPGEIED